MNREQKFRFYHKGILLEELTLKQIAEKCDFKWADDVIVCHYTGMKDNNKNEKNNYEGEEIYEGDICECVGETKNFGNISLKGIMKWWELEKRYSIQFSSEIEFVSISDVHKIGNIHENK